MRVTPSTTIPTAVEAHPPVVANAPIVAQLPPDADLGRVEPTRVALLSSALTPPKREPATTANVDPSAAPALRSVSTPNQVIAAVPHVVADPVRVTPSLSTPTAVAAVPPVVTNAPSVSQIPLAADVIRAAPTHVAELSPALAPGIREPARTANVNRSASPELQSVVAPGQVAAVAPQVVMDPVPMAAPEFAPLAPKRQLPVAPNEPILPVNKPDEVEFNSRASPAIGRVPGTQQMTTSVPNRNQVFVSTDPADENVFNFQFAAAGDELAAPPVVPGRSPSAESLSGAPGPPLPSTGPIPFGGGALLGPCGCAYGAGQSGERVLFGVNCGRNGAPCHATWSDRQCIPWSLFGPGEYVGPARTADVPTYFLRVNDFLTLTFIESRHKSAQQYHIGVGDRLQVEWLQGAANMETRLNRELLVQPDGTVTLPLVGDVTAAGKTVNEFRDELVVLRQIPARSANHGDAVASQRCHSGPVEGGHLQIVLVGPNSRFKGHPRRNDPGRRHWFCVCSGLDPRRTAV